MKGSSRSSICEFFCNWIRVDQNNVFLKASIIPNSDETSRCPIRRRTSIISEMLRAKLFDIMIIKCMPFCFLETNNTSWRFLNFVMNMMPFLLQIYAMNIWGQKYKFLLLPICERASQENNWPLHKHGHMSKQPTYKQRKKIENQHQTQRHNTAGTGCHSSTTSSLTILGWREMAHKHIHRPPTTHLHQLRQTR